MNKMHRGITIKIFRKLINRKSTQCTFTRTCKTTTTVAVENEESEIPANLIDNDEDLIEQREYFEQKRNKSGLLPQHRNMLYDKLPYEESQSWIHETVKYKQMMFGRYGLASGIDPRICFPTKKDTEVAQEYERVAYPFTVQEMMENVRKEQKQKAEIIHDREAQIAKKVEKLEQWKKELNDKIAKKEAEAKAAKERKERLVEEVRRHFGFKLDARDERFKELLAQKEKEDKKKQKEVKRQAKEAKMLAKLVEKNVDKKEAGKNPEPN